MCAISGSFEKNNLKELYRLNAYRGEINYSLTRFDWENGKAKLGIIYKDAGGMPEYLVDSLPEKENSFYLCHSQAPTTNTSDTHPAIYGPSMLWHNGIIKQKVLEKDAWDTRWLLQQIADYGWSALSRIDGTFACVMFNADEGKIYYFRNEISPLFISTNMDISSTKSPGYSPLRPNVVWSLDLEKRYITPVAEFSTHENPYYMQKN